MHSPAVRADVSKIAAFRRTSARIFNTTGRQERALTSFLRIAALGLSTSARIRVSLSASLSLSLICALSLGAISGCSGAPRTEAFFLRLQVRRQPGQMIGALCAPLVAVADELLQRGHSGSSGGGALRGGLVKLFVSMHGGTRGAQR